MAVSDLARGDGSAEGAVVATAIPAATHDPDVAVEVAAGCRLGSVQAGASGVQADARVIALSLTLTRRHSGCRGKASSGRRRRGPTRSGDAKPRR